MIIWRRDRCGHEVRGDQIVGHEFDYSKHFKSLAVKVKGMRDLCNSCMDIAEGAAKNFSIERYRRKEAAIAEALGTQDEPEGIASSFTDTIKRAFAPFSCR